MRYSPAGQDTGQREAETKDVFDEKTHSRIFPFEKTKASITFIDRQTFDNMKLSSVKVVVHHEISSV